jgi:hypothetical protein
VSLAALALEAGVRGQARSPSAQAPLFRTATNLTLVRFQVIRDYRYIGGLTAADIRLLENGTERPVDFFEGGCGAARTTPIDIALLFDISSSVMDSGLLNWVVYRAPFLDALSSARTSVYAFSNKRWRVVEGTRDPDALRDALRRVADSDYVTGPPGGVRVALSLPPKQSASIGESWIYEALLGTAREPAPSDSTRVIFLVTDGIPTTSTPVKYVSDNLQALGVSVFPMLVGHHTRTPSDRPKSDDMALMGLSWLAEQTGGRTFDPPAVNADTIRTALAIVSETIRCEYVVGVTLSSSSGSRSHTLEVQLRSKKLGELRGGRRTILD